MIQPDTRKGTVEDKPKGEWKVIPEEPPKTSSKTPPKGSPKGPLNTTPKDEDNEVELVIASMRKENVTWLHDYLPNWKKNIYVVDDPSAELTVPKNKGREAMVFLTYVLKSSTS